MIFNFFKSKKKSESRFIKGLNIIFLIIFFALIIMPSLFRNRFPQVKSKYENRYLAEFPIIVTENNEFNFDYFKQFDDWANDNLWLRNDIIHTFSQFMYDIFSVIQKGSSFIVGQNKEIYFIGESALDNYLGVEYVDEKQEEEGKKFLTKLNRIASMSNASFYYIPVPDKESVMPETFAKSINKVNDNNEIDRFIEKIEKETDVKIYNPKELLIRQKDKYDVYSRTGDVTHWSERGAYNTYVDFMKYLRKNELYNYRILSEKDFDIKIIDSNPDLYGGIYDVDKLESFYLKEINYKKVSDEFTNKENEDNPRMRGRYYNKKLDGKKNILIVGDSYISSFWLYYLPESFNNTIFLHFGSIALLPEAVIKYHPDIIIYENASREFFVDNDELVQLNKILDNYIDFFTVYYTINK